MPTIDQLNAALLKADSSGDTQNAQLFANQIKALRTQQPTGSNPTSPQDAAFAAGQSEGEGEGGTMAAIGQAAQQGTFGLSNYVNAGMRYAGQRVAGIKNPDDFSTDLAMSRGKSQGEIEAHPIAGTVGGVAGGVMAGGGAKLALKAMGAGPVLDALAPQAGQKVANVAKAAATGAAVGGTTALAEGQPAPQAAQTAALSAVAAPVAGKVIGFALNKLQPAAAKAMQTLAENIGETPAVLQGAYDSFMKLTGRVPSMAELVGLKSQGQLRDLAKANPTIADAAIKAANIGNAPLHEQIAASQNASFPQSSSGLTELRDSDMDQNMKAQNPQTGVALKDVTVSDPQGILLSPHVEYALRPNTAINARLGQENPVLDRALGDQATIGDVEVIRKALRDQQNSLMRPAPGSASAKDPVLASEFGNIANKVEGIGKRAAPDYGTALQGYRDASNYAEGFSHGFNGKSFGDTGDDSRLAGALKTDHGSSGYQHGNALYTGRQALEAIAPGTIRQPDNGPGAGHVAQAAMAASSGGISAVYHGLKALPIVGDRVPESVQQIIAKQLFDPQTTSQGIKNLTRAGAQAKDIRALAATIGGTTAQRMSDYLSQQGQ